MGFAWWCFEIVCGFLFLIALYFTATTIYRLVFTPYENPEIRFFQNGIKRPFQKNLICWDQIVDFQTRGYSLKSKDYREIVIFLKKNPGIVANFMPKKISLMSRCLEKDESEDLDAALAVIAKHTNC